MSVPVGPRPGRLPYMQISESLRRGREGGTNGLEYASSIQRLRKNEDKLVESELALPKPLGTLSRRVGSGQFPFKEIFLCLCLVAYNRNSVTDNLRGLYGTRLENLLALKSRDIPRAHGRGRELLLQILNCCD